MAQVENIKITFKDFATWKLKVLQFVIKILNLPKVKVRVNNDKLIVLNVKFEIKGTTDGKE